MRVSKKKKKKDPYFDEEQGIAEIANQINESYQSGVIEDKLNNNKAIHTYNNKTN